MLNWLNNLIKLFLFLLPWQTIWIYRELFLNGVKWEYGTLGFYGTEILFWIIIILFLFWLLKEKRSLGIEKFSWTKDGMFLATSLFFVFYLFLTIIWAGDKSLALQQSLWVMQSVLLFLVIYLIPFEKEKLIKWFIYGAIIPSLLGIWQFLTQTTFANTFLGLASHPVWQAGTAVIQSETIGRWLRAYGPFSHPNLFGGYLAVVIFLFFILKEKNKILWVAFILSLFSLFFTFSRGAWLAVLLLLFYCLVIKKYHLVILSLIVFSILAVIYFPLVQTRYSGEAVSEVRSVTERVAGYSEAWKLFKDQPLLGVGPGNYTYALYEKYPTRPGWEYQPVHNVFVLFVVEQGILGLLLVLFMFVTFFRYSQKFSVLVIPLLFLFFFDHYFYSSYVGLMVLSLYLGLILRSGTQSLPS